MVNEVDGVEVIVLTSYVLCMAELEACAVEVGARRGREGNLVRTLIRPNGWRKVARSAETRQKAADEREEDKTFQREIYVDVQRG